MVERITYVDVLDNINFAKVLAERADGYTVRTIAMKVLHNNVCAVRFERYTVIPIVDIRILNHDIRAPIRVPAICVLCNVLARTRARNVDVAEHNVRRVRNKVVVLWRISQLQI